jgi:hypothetical protein
MVIPTFDIFPEAGAEEDADAVGSVVEADMTA